MAGLRFTELQSRPMEFLDFTSVILDEFQQLVPPFEAAFQARMVAWRMDGKPRTARRFTVYKNCPLPTPEDRLLFILVYLKTYALQVVQGRLFGMGQGKANQWIHVLLPVLLAALRALGDAPARSLTALTQQLGVSEADVAPLVAPLAEEPAPVATVPATTPISPLLPMMGPNGGSSAPKTRLNRRSVIAARKRTIQSKMSCSSMPSSRSSASATPMAVASMTSPLPTPPRTPYLLGAGCCRTWAFWRSRSPRWRSSCPPRNHAARNSPWTNNGPTRPCTIADSASSMSTAASSAAASSKTVSVSGKRASATL